MTLSVSITLDDVFDAVSAFLLDPDTGVVPVGTPVLRGPLNRVAQPPVSHVIITLIHRRQLRTNVETDVDPFPTEGGAVLIEQGTQVTAQMDFYGVESGDWAAIFSTVWRSEYGVKALAPVCAPLYADDGRMLPLVTGEEQYLERWHVPAMLQYNPVTSMPQQFADTATVDLINVDVRYPP